MNYRESKQRFLFRAMSVVNFFFFFFFFRSKRERKIKRKRKERKRKEGRESMTSRDFYDETREKLASGFSRNEERQRIFRRDLRASQKLFRRKLTKELTRGASRRVADDLRKRTFFDERLIGEAPTEESLSSTLEGAERESVLDVLGKDQKEEQIVDYPVGDYLVETGLTDEGMRAAIDGLPAGWEEHVIGDSDAYSKYSKAEMLKAAEEDQELAIIAMSGGFKPAENALHDEGRAYFYNIQTGEVRFTPPPGSSKLVCDTFLKFGRVFQAAAGAQAEWARLRHLGARRLIQASHSADEKVRKEAVLEHYDDVQERVTNSYRH